MKTIKIEKKHDCEEMKRRLVPQGYEPQHLLDGKQAIHVLKPDGTTLLKYVPDWFSAYTSALKPIMRKMATGTNNRMSAAGAEKNAIVPNMDGKGHKIKQNGAVSKTHRGATVHSGIAGNFERTVRQPYCRQTSFVLQNLSKWRKYIGFMQKADAGFAEHLPERHEAQKEYASATHEAWVVPGTCFTTATINRNWQTALHTDKGDLEQGFGVMACFRNELYEGAELCFPAFSCGINMRDGSLLLADVHEWHGNRPFTAVKAGFERISNVLYYRQHMRECGTPAEELTRAKNRVKGEAIRGK